MKKGTWVKCTCDECTMKKVRVIFFKRGGVFYFEETIETEHEEIEDIKEQIENVFNIAREYNYVFFIDDADVPHLVVNKRTYNAYQKTKTNMNPVIIRNWMIEYKKKNPGETIQEIKWAAQKNFRVKA